MNLKQRTAARERRRLRAKRRRYGQWRRKNPDPFAKYWQRGDGNGQLSEAELRAWFEETDEAPE